MRTTLKIVLPLIVSVAAVSLLFAAYQVRRERRILRNDLSRRAEILGESLQESVEPLFEPAQNRNLQPALENPSLSGSISSIGDAEFSMDVQKNQDVKTVRFLVDDNTKVGNSGSLSRRELHRQAGVAHTA